MTLKIASFDLRQLRQSIAELREIANGHDDILAEAAGSWYASPATMSGMR